MQITLRQFEVFLAVARAGSFRAAAEVLHLSQPALSQHVAELERELGARLFDRLGRRTALTEAGRILEDHARRVFATLASARETVAELQGLKRGSLVIGASTTPGIYVLPHLAARFQERYPGITLRVRIANSAHIEEQVRANELDLGVVGGHGFRPGEECLAKGMPDELVLIVPPGHRWSRRREIPPDLLGAERLLVREEGSASRQVTERALQHVGARIGPTMELGHTEAIKQAVMAGLGVAFVSLHAIGAELRAGQLSALRLRGYRIRRHFHVIHNEARTLGASARAFMNLLEDAGGPDRGVSSRGKAVTRR
jgi:DNA-binding transcriptional LysR family regulator